MPDDGPDNGFKYWAFISYSHADKQWGDWLHRALETYRVPKRLVGAVSPAGERVPARVYPIFRDREELPVSASLPENINRALEQSRYLIVICSPRAATSRWVNEEIKTFKRLGREDRVLALMVAGEPNASEDGGKPGFLLEDECFPPSLCYRWDRANGELSTERTEPIAADARPDKDGKRHAKLKLLAGLLGVNYDQLRQREQERRVRQLSYLVAATLLLLAVFAGLAVYSEVQRRRAEQASAIAQEQRQRAEAQEAEAVRQRNAAEEANRQFQAQLHEASVSDLATAQQGLDEGDWRRAIAYYGRALKYERKNRAAGISLWMAAVYGGGNRDRLPQRLLLHPDHVVLAVFSPDGKRVLTGSGNYGKPGEARLWNAATGEPLGEPLRHKLRVNSAAFSHDGRLIVTASEDKTARLWDAVSGKPLGPPMPHDNSVRSAVFSPDDARVLTIDNVAKLWDAKTGNAIGTPLQQPGPVNSAVFSPDGTRVLTAGNDKTARLWDAATGTQIGESFAHSSWVETAAFSPDGALMVTAGYDKLAHVWNTATGHERWTLQFHKELVHGAVFSPDGTRVLTASNDGTACLWDITTGKLLGEPLKHGRALRSAVFSSDGLRVVTASNDKTAQVWDAATHKPLGEFLRHDEVVNLAVFSPDGTRVLTASDDGTAGLWEAASDRPAGVPLRHDDRVASAAFNSQGTRIVTAGMDNVARIWDAVTGRAEGTLPHPQRSAGLRSAAFNPDGTRVVTSSWDNRARQWDVAAGKLVNELSGHLNTIASASYDPAGKRIVTAGWDNTARLWAADSGKQIGQPLGEPKKDPDEIVASAVFSPDGTQVLTASGSGVLRLWNPKEGKAVGSPMLHGDQVNQAAFDRTGMRLITACSDKTARLWNAASYKELTPPLQGTAEVLGAAFSPDGEFAVTACADGTARLWSLSTRSHLGEPWHHEGKVTGIAFHPDGQRVVTASEDRTARLWETDLSLPSPPEALDRLVVILSGLRFDEASGKFQEVGIRERFDSREALLRDFPATSRALQGWDALIRWSLLPVSERRLTPGSTLANADLAERELVSGQETGVREVLRLQPGHPLLQLALAAFDKNAVRAAFLRNDGLRRLPVDVAVCLRAAALLRAQQQPTLALQALEKSLPAVTTPSAAFLADLALTRWLCSDADGAVNDCQRLISTDASYADAAKLPAVVALPDNDKTALLAAITETLRRHPELKPGPGR